MPIMIRENAFPIFITCFSIGVLKVGQTTKRK